MEGSKVKVSKVLNTALILVLWIFAAWLFWPLVGLESIDFAEAKIILYRSAIGIAIMLIFLGKTIFDLLFPQGTARQVPLIHTIFLSVYSVVLAGGIIYIAARMVVLFIKSSRALDSINVL